MEIRDLRRGLAGDVVLPGDETWDAARQAWNLAVDQRPVAVVYPESADDVAATVAVRRGARLPDRLQRRRPQRGPDRLDGRHAAPQDRADARDQIDAAARRARVEAGRPVAAARRRGRRARPRVPRRHVAQRRRRSATRSAAASAGWSGRTGSRATASSRPRSSRPTAARIHADRDTEPELFWAIRGGGGNVGAVTAIELELFPIAEVYAGALFWPIERADRGPQRVARRGSRPCPRRANRSGGCCSCPTSRSSPSTCAAARSSWSSSRSLGSAADGDGARPAAAGPRSRVRHGRDHAGQATSASSTWTRRTRCPTRARGSC